jgi:hypothetical protein
LPRQQLVEKTTSNDVRNREEEEFAAGDDNARSIGTTVPHELEGVEDEDQIEKQGQWLEEEDERRTRRAALSRPRTPEPMGFGMTHLSDDEDQWLGSPRPPSVIDELLERLTTLSSELESAVGLSSSFQAQHAAAHSTISALKSKVTSLDSLVKAQATPPPPPPIEEPESTEPPQSVSLTQVLADWKQSVEGRWSFVREEWASERERLASAREKWESKVKAVETNLRTTSAKFDAEVASLAVLQRRQQQQQASQSLGLGNGEVVKGFHGSGCRIQSNVIYM